ncbi:PREDICTED: uncharacterized protein LOC108383204 isoform X1 [Rhagoletis zephyria]|uniref:uncharacterized protein LOC108383204 isoform X1 n=1 Tax=Rhagoletis zephyria TaxID=28612 RepID=UPI0008112B87|nr:PREDICTED: uncharacterized protein LOC108383204 isoform X1 [Rhagoletis zephyria]
MCKFTNRLFVFTLLALFGIPRSLLVDAAATREHRKGPEDVNILDLLSLGGSDNNYDVHYDQRQKGDENLRVRMDGVFIEMPPDNNEGVADDLMKEILSYLLYAGEGEELLLGLTDVQSSRDSTKSPEKLQQLGVLKENKLESEQRSEAQQHNVIDTVPEREVEGRNGLNSQRGSLLAENREPESKRVGVITKHHFNTLLNLLKRMRRN